MRDALGDGPAGRRPAVRPATGGGLSARLGRAFAVIGILIAGSVLVAAVSGALLVLDFQPAVEHLADGRRSVLTSHAGMLDEETGVRGYLVTGDRDFLQPYQTGQQEVASGDAATDSVLAGFSDLTQPIIAVRLAQQRWITGWAQPAASSPPPTGAALTMLLENGKQLFDAYRRSDDALTAAVAARIDSEQSAERRTLVAAFLLVGALLIATAVVAAVQRRRLQAAVVAPVAELVESMRRIRAGDLAARPELGDAPAELREVASGLTEMTDDLVARQSVAAELERESRTRADRLRIIVDLAQEIAGSLSVRYVVRSAGVAAVRASEFDAVRVWLGDGRGRHLVAMYDSAGPGGEAVGIAPVTIGDGIVGRAARNGRIVASDSGSSVPADHHPDRPAVGIAVPMIVGARVVGVLELEADAPRVADAGLVDVLVSLAGQAAGAVEAARLHQETEQQSRTDALTALPNRRRFDEDLAAEVARSRRYRRPVSLVMVDVDHFKHINDAQGHQAGDEILQEFATTLSDGIRANDTAYRYGGEEFALLLRETDARSAFTMVERVRSRIEHRFAARESGGLTASFGIAAIPEDAGDAAAVVASADAALYRAKRTGRNRTVLAGAEAGG